MAEEAGRYTLEKSATGYVRMDTQTGEMSVCEERGGQLVCKLAADERAAFQDELDRLQSKVTGLEERLAAVENNPVLNPQNLLPSEEEFQRSLGYMERFFRRFLDIVKDMDKESGTPEKT
jgi:flagellar motility protein MotE (MotC chaperone)